MKVLFFAENPGLYIEYALRLEKNNIPFWTVDNFNDLHYMVSQMAIDVVFADYSIANFSSFDVYQHIKEHDSDLILLFINQPSRIESLFVQWEDAVARDFPDKWTEELESLLRIVANQPLVDYLPFKPARVQDLLEQIENDSEKNLYRESIDTASLVAENPVKEINLVPKGIEPLNQPVAVESNLIEEFYRIKRLQRLSFEEFVILDLLKKRKTEFITIQDMMDTLDIPNDKKNLKKIYRYVHNIRGYLEKQKEENYSLMHVKKGVYCLVSIHTE